MLIFENDFAPLVEALRKACPAIERFVTVDDKIPAADLTYEELLSAGRPERVDYTDDRRKLDCRAVLHQRLHRHAQGRDAFAPHAVPARPVGGDHVQPRR